GFQFFEKAFFNRIRNGFHHDEAFGGNAALSRVDQAARDTAFDRGFQIGIFQNDVRIAPSELQYGFFESLRTFLRHRSPSGRTSRKSDRTDPWVGDQMGDVATSQNRRSEDIFGKAG